MELKGSDPVCSLRSHLPSQLSASFAAVLGSELLAQDRIDRAVHIPSLSATIHSVELRSTRQNAILCKIGNRNLES